MPCVHLPSTGILNTCHHLWLLFFPFQTCLLYLCSVLPACVYVHHGCAEYSGDQRRGSDPLDWVVVNNRVDTGNLTQVLCSNKCP